MRILLILLYAIVGAVSETDCEVVFRVWKMLGKRHNHITDCCRLEGIICRGSKVTFIRWVDLRLKGNIPVDLFKLSDLIYLELSENKRLSGSIPSLGEGETRAPLEFLSLTDNNLTGTIPADLFKFTNLISLDLSNNKLSGSVPDEINNLADLRFLRLHNNSFSGKIRIERHALKELRSVVLSFNNFENVIPAGIFHAKIKEVHLNDNKFTGNIPTAAMEAVNMQVLIVNNNRLSGSLHWGLANCKSLREFGIYNNWFSTDLPEEFEEAFTTEVKDNIRRALFPHLTKWYYPYRYLTRFMKLNYTREDTRPPRLIPTHKRYLDYFIMKHMLTNPQGTRRQIWRMKPDYDRERYLIIFGPIWHECIRQLFFIPSWNSDPFA